MTAPTREDIRIDTREWTGCKTCWSNKSHVATDAELAALGYVKLDVDVEKLKKMASDPDPREHLMGMLNLLFVVLAALDPEGDT
jgi:hypothetical protein